MSDRDFMKEKETRYEIYWKGLSSIKDIKRYVDGYVLNLLDEIAHLKREVQGWKEMDSDTMEHWKAEKERNDRLMEDNREFKEKLDFFERNEGKFRLEWDEKRGLYEISLPRGAVFVVQNKQ